MAAAPRRRRWRRQGAALLAPEDASRVTQEVARQPSRAEHGARAVKAAPGGGVGVAEPRGGRGLRRSARAGRDFPLGKDSGGKGRGPRRAASVRLLKIFHWGRGRQSGFSARAVTAQMFSAQPASAHPAPT